MSEIVYDWLTLVLEAEDDEPETEHIAYEFSCRDFYETDDQGVYE